MHKSLCVYLHFKDYMVKAIPEITVRTQNAVKLKFD